MSCLLLHLYTLYLKAAAEFVSPVATLTYNIISSTDANDGDDFKSYVDNFSSFIEILKIQIKRIVLQRFNPKNSFDNSFFSKSEIEILESITKKYKTYTKEQISENLIL